jgi:hypothetical protein
VGGALVPGTIVTFHIALRRYEAEKSERPGVKVKRERRMQKVDAVYGSRTHDFCLTTIPEWPLDGRAAS